MWMAPWRIRSSLGNECRLWGEQTMCHGRQLSLMGIWNWTTKATNVAYGGDEFIESSQDSEHD